MITIKPKVQAGLYLPELIAFPYLPEPTINQAIDKVNHLVHLLYPDACLRRYNSNCVVCFIPPKLDRSPTLIKFRFEESRYPFEIRQSDSLLLQLYE